MVDHPTCSRALRTAVGLLAAVTLTLVPGPAYADEYSDADYFVAVANDLRAWHGVHPLAVSGDLQDVAMGWAGQMARGGYLAHNSSLPAEVGGWWALGENLGYGWENGGWEIHVAWINSPSHFANLVSPEYNQIGVGVAYDSYGGLYVAQVFAGR